MEIVGRVALVLLGIAVVAWVLDAAVRTFVLPRAAPVRLTRWIAQNLTKAFRLVARDAHSYERRDKVMALYGPITLLTLPAVWLAMILAAFSCIFYAIDDIPVGTAIRYSGSALFTLGFMTSDETDAVAVVFIESAIGLALLALLISYLPTIYAAFSKREVAVTRLGVRAGTPPTPGELLERAQRAGFMHRLDEVFEEWEVWFVELEETHTSLVILNFFRSPNPDRSWVTAAGAVLDTAALRMSAIDLPFSPSGGICIRAGFTSLRAIGRYFGIAFDPDPRPDAPVAVLREEFEAVLDRLAAAGVPLKADRDQAWRDFCGWRVNYETVLLRLAEITMAPYAPWVSDRSAVWSPS